MASEPPWSTIERASGALTLRLHVQPGAKQTAIAGAHGDRLKIRLAAAPVDGKANAALIGFLALAFEVPTRNVELLAGASSRRKTLRITAPARRPDLDWPPDSSAGSDHGSRQ